MSLLSLQKPWKPRFVVKEMEHMNMDELLAQIQMLKVNLENVPVKGGALQKPKKQRYVLCRTE